MELGLVKIKNVLLVVFLLLALPIQVNALTATDSNKKLDAKLKNYNIILYSRQINTMSLYKYIPFNVQGLTDYYRHMVVIHDSTNPVRNQHLLDHEKGHIFDSSTVVLSDGTKQENPFYYSNSQEFINIFNLEYNSISKYSQEAFSQVNRNEYFGECFSWYKENPEKLKESSPLTYAFIDKAYKSTING